MARIPFVSARGELSASRGSWGHGPSRRHDPRRRRPSHHAHVPRRQPVGRRLRRARGRERRPTPGACSRARSPTSRSSTSACPTATVSSCSSTSATPTASPAASIRTCRCSCCPDARASSTGCAASAEVATTTSSKPFSYYELSARVRALLRRTRRRPGTGRMRIGSLELDPMSRQVWVRGEPVALSKKEYALLRALAGDPTRVFTREELLRGVWGFRAMGAYSHARLARLPPAPEAEPRRRPVRGQRVGRRLPPGRREHRLMIAVEVGGWLAASAAAFAAAGVWRALSGAWRTSPGPATSCADR